MRQRRALPAARHAPTGPAGGPCMLEVLWVLYAQEKELNDLYRKGPPFFNDNLVDLWPHTTMYTFRRRAATIALSHRHTMRMRTRRRTVPRCRFRHTLRSYVKLRVKPDGEEAVMPRSAVLQL